MKAAKVSRYGVVRTTLLGGLLTFLFSVAGFYGSRYVPPVILVGFLKYAIGLVGVVWLFSLNVYNKLSDVTDMGGLDYKQHRNLEIEVRSRLQWFWVRAFFLAFVALAMYSPSILSEAKMPIPEWVFSIACGALALALFSLRRLWAEMEEIRELRSHVKELERREKERADRVKGMKDSVKGDWEPDARLDGFRGDKEQAEG